MTSRRDFLKLVVAAPAVILTPGLLMRVRSFDLRPISPWPMTNFERMKLDVLAKQAEASFLAEIERTMAEVWKATSIPRELMVSKNEAVRMDRALFEYYSENKNKFAPPAFRSASRRVEGFEFDRRG